MVQAPEKQGGTVGHRKVRRQGHLPLRVTLPPYLLGDELQSGPGGRGEVWRQRGGEDVAAAGQPLVLCSRRGVEGSEQEGKGGGLS